MSALEQDGYISIEVHRVSCVAMCEQQEGCPELGTDGPGTCTEGEGAAVAEISPAHIGITTMACTAPFSCTVQQWSLHYSTHPISPLPPFFHPQLDLALTRRIRFFQSDTDA